ncbi:phosphoglucosamine mutase [Candidatus Berkiella cookevillensis]|uniref:Phosphoglucosamine mutase n=1 Tax=Candidatus Berkiella cookevillensis TaxID=437022 RepID=A0A0Q9YPD2_9GAMM|nr:phosphoglucosamine mutase [Candidatus Berkiella cookevillensis]MCS5707832.1 phosphoglucosamine mutase [Candidatus Berkiella cookevillensis]
MRKYFGTDGIRGKTGQFPITADFALKLGWAVGQVLAQDGRGKVLIGQDTRVSGYMLSAALEAGMTASGLDVHLLGAMPTPGVAYLTKSLNAQIGAVVSASHNPYYDNGIKFFSGDGKKLPDLVESKIESYLDKAFVTVEGTRIGQQTYLQDAAGRYIEFCKHSFPKDYDLKGIKIVVDCANGATSYIAPHVFTELGADVIVINHQPDGFNINDKCGSTFPQSLQAEVLKHRAEVGIAFDGDGDRLILVDHKGELVDGDEILFIIAMHMKDKLQGGVVGTLMSNFGLELAFQAQKIAFLRARVGDRYVLDKLMEHNWVLGGENSGHIICLEHATTGDGIIAALQVLKALCEKNDSLHTIKQGMTKFPQVLKNVKVTKPQSIIVDDTLQNAIAKMERSLQNKGRILVRASGTEPLIRVMVEGEDPIFVNNIADQMADVVEKVAQTLA